MMWSLCGSSVKLASFYIKSGGFDFRMMHFSECATFTYHFHFRPSVIEATNPPYQNRTGQSRPNHEFRKTEQPPSYHLQMDYEVRAKPRKKVTFYFIMHLKVIGGRLFCFAKLVVWRALSGPILVSKIPNCYYRGSKMKNEKRTLTFTKMHHMGIEPSTFTI